MVMGEVKQIIFPQLLTKQRVFYKQIMLAACQVTDQVTGASSVGWSRHLLDACYRRLCDNRTDYTGT